MNDSQLHDRLSTLADDLAPGGDPYELVSGARGLHRRRRRTRIGVAGATLAVALVAVGVPTAIGALSAPEGSDAAAPSTAVPPSPYMEVSVDEMATRIAATTPHLTLTAPRDSATCPDVPALLSLGFRLQPGSSLVSGCSWTRASHNAADEAPYSAYLRYYPDGFPPVRAIGCPTATIPGSSPEATVQQTCATGSAGAWKISIPAARGLGGWVVTVAAGAGASPDVKIKTVELAVTLVQVVDQQW